MSTAFSEAINNTGIVQQVRNMLRVDAGQYPAFRIANSCNNYQNRITGYALGADKRFQWDNTNHTALPEGKQDLTINVSDYSFTTDEQGNAIVNLVGVSALVNGNYVPLEPVDRATIDVATFGFISGTVPTQYDKIADNIIRLNILPSQTVSLGLKFYFQRVGSYFEPTDTVKTTGCSPLLDRGFVIASVYDALLSGIGSANLQAVSVEMQREEQAMKTYFSIRNNDEVSVMSPIQIDSE